MKHEAKSPRSGPRVAADAKRDRKSTTGIDGSPKKGGHGSKFTWSGDHTFSHAEMGLLERGTVDAKDPNFQEEVDHRVQIA
ncbi:hypothetical protein MLD38_006240 [Melastoma candidum]|uniref:Uncharacterized protein n=1 Tax=Melastoma candidum TaxID=119954 RepID=A0ACB9RP58_9MYRT|nr:hypothetical protein MLD38_006240 [Melastoma candidum]